MGAEPEPRVAIVTGGAGGLGSAIVRRFLGRALSGEHESRYHLQG